MKKCLFWLLAASLVLAACGPQTAVTPEVINPCVDGTGFTPGDQVILGTTEDFRAVLDTWSGLRPGGTVTVVLPDIAFPAAGAEFKAEGEVQRLAWGKRVQVWVALCDGVYRYLAKVESTRVEYDPACVGDFLAKSKPWPFFDEILLFRPAVTDEEVWLYSGAMVTTLAYFGEGVLVKDVKLDRPRAGNTAVTLLDVASGTVTVVLKNCQETLFYKAYWRSR